MREEGYASPPKQRSITPGHHGWAHIKTVLFLFPSAHLASLKPLDRHFAGPRRREIRQWLAIDPAVQAPDIKPGIVVHVRRTDYVQMRWALPFSYYDEAIETLLPYGGDVWIVTDDSHDPFLRHFSRWKPKFFRGNPLETMLFMSRSSKLVLSQSTFGWWPAFLGDVESVACPLPQSGIWSAATEFPGIDLIERDRFICLPCTDYRPTRLESAHQLKRRVHRRLVEIAIRSLNLPLVLQPP